MKLDMDYKICSKTIMDTVADPDITFDENGVSNYVPMYEELIKTRIPSKETAKKRLSSIVEKIKIDGKNNEYDCIVGVSGGVDSTYVAYIVKELGLRPLAVHLDNGWNSELAVSNIEKILNKLNIDLYTEVLNWEEFKDIQLAFLKASVPDGEIPTDHAIYAVLHRIAAQKNIKYIISGSNLKTEAILPKSWATGHLDWKYIKSIHSKFGTVKIKTFPHLTLFDIFYYLWIKRIKTVPILNYIDYKKSDAMKILTEKLGWVYYGGKHYESIYTRFFQGYIMPKKFKMDKRRGHLSTLICSGEITREEALEEIKKDPYPSDDMKMQDLDFVLKKFGISKDEFNKIMQAPVKSFNDYPNNYSKIHALRKVFDAIRKRKDQKS